MLKGARNSFRPTNCIDCTMYNNNLLFDYTLRNMFWCGYAYCKKKKEIVHFNDISWQQMNVPTINYHCHIPLMLCHSSQSQCTIPICSRSRSFYIELPHLRIRIASHKNCSPPLINAKVFDRTKQWTILPNYNIRIYAYSVFSIHRIRRI